MILTSTQSGDVHLELVSLRQNIARAYRKSERECVRSLIESAELNPSSVQAIAARARSLVEGMRADPISSGISDLMKEYSLSSDEGIALMCLAEALLRIPDNETRDILIRDKICGGDWASHFSRKRSAFSNAATWGLVLSDKVLSRYDEAGLRSALMRVIQRIGEPVIRRSVDWMMHVMGDIFVAGETIQHALARAETPTHKQFLHSYDMLGEGATNARDAERYYEDYRIAIDEIGKTSSDNGLYDGPGISIKLSALHPRYQRSQRDRVMSELLPRVKSLAVSAKRYGIGLNIDAEESDRLDLSLDILQKLSEAPELAGWNGLGFVVQAYGKRCDAVIDFLIALARRCQRRLMVRLVKGAYWDAEIKRAQLDGLEDFPVFTRKAHTDISYIAAARKLLSALDAVFPQFATHNAQTLSTILEVAGPYFEEGDYEFQCLYGMGESLYSRVVGSENLNRPCRIYCPVGRHETLLAYLVRRLLENGANSSFVNLISRTEVPVERLIEDPAAVVRSSEYPMEAHRKILLPVEILGRNRKNSRGLDLSDDITLSTIDQWLAASKAVSFVAAANSESRRSERRIVNPGERSDEIGTVYEASEADVSDAVGVAMTSDWAKTPRVYRTEALLKAADMLSARAGTFVPLLMREAGKTAENAISELREAIDFLRYYAKQAGRTVSNEAVPLGPAACISPWNFPLAIFTGQIAAALVMGNPVLAKPAQETPLVAAACISVLHEAGIPPEALQLLPGGAVIGQALVAHPDVAAVVFTGSARAAKLIQMVLSKRTSIDGSPIVLIAETGGLNAMIVDSSSLPEQVVADVIASAFDSAGQRCSALRLLCVQENVAANLVTMIREALKEQRVGRTDAIATDIGPIITAHAAESIADYIADMRGQGFAVANDLTECADATGSFVPPTIIEIAKIKDLRQEVFGPVLHIMRFDPGKLDELISEINATGFALTFGLHTRLDSRIDHVIGRIKAGNIYVNRNVVGAVVGVQPFGGRGMSGTGPKAGGPLYIHRLARRSGIPLSSPQNKEVALGDLINWLAEEGLQRAADAARNAGQSSLLGLTMDLPGPVGELNRYSIRSCGNVLIFPETPEGFFQQIACALAAGADITADLKPDLTEVVSELPSSVARRIRIDRDWARSTTSFAGVLIEGDQKRVVSLLGQLAGRDDQIPIVQSASSQAIGEAIDAFDTKWLVDEVSVSINTTAAGGNASLMTLA